MSINEDDNAQGWRWRLYRVIFEADTPAGKAFDLALLLAIVISVIAVLLESVADIRARYGLALRGAEWAFTLLFTVEYILRLICSPRPLAYGRSFFGLIDLLAILPTYLSLVFTGAQTLIVIRALRLLRVFRVLKLVRYVGEARVLSAALRNSARKILIFLGTVLTIQLIIGAIMYLIEGEEHGFSSIPHAMYWAIVTMTTVGYGDITPHTTVGKFLASAVMILGYGIIAVPTGIVSVELASARSPTVTTRTCPQCTTEGHDLDARYCKHCGARLPEP